MGITFDHYRWFDSWRVSPSYIWKGKYFEELHSLPAYDLGSDVFGIFSYTKSIDQFLERTLNDLKLDGQLYIGGQLWTTLIQDHHGNFHPLLEWLKQLKGVNVSEEKGVLFFKRTTAEPITVSRLQLLRFDETQPPVRVLKVENWVSSDP